MLQPRPPLRRCPIAPGAVDASFSGRPRCRRDQAPTVHPAPARDGEGVGVLDLPRRVHRRREAEGSPWMRIQLPQRVR